MANQHWKGRDRREVVARYVANRVEWLQEHRTEARSKGTLSSLRRAVAKRPGEILDICDFEFGTLPEGLRGTGNEPATPGEWAVHLALALYATHQQSQEHDMHRLSDPDKHQYWGLGNAVKHLAIKQSEQLEQRQMPSRFAALVTSESIEELAHYARQLVQQLRSASIPLDYGRLAGQLYWYQMPEYRGRVCLEWAREFSQSKIASTEEQDDSTKIGEQAN